MVSQTHLITVMLALLTTGTLKETVLALADSSDDISLRLRLSRTQTDKG